MKPANKIPKRTVLSSNRSRKGAAQLKRHLGRHSDVNASAANRSRKGAAQLKRPAP